MSFNISYLRTRYLDIYLTLIHPSRCVERFELTEDEDVVINVKQAGESENFKQDEYCVEFEQVINITFDSTLPVYRINHVA